MENELDENERVARLTDTEQLLEKLGMMRKHPLDVRVRDRVDVVLSEEEDGKVVRHNRHGRTEGASNLTDDEREVIGTLANLGTASKVAEVYGLAPSTVHQAKNARTTQYSGQDEELRAKLDKNLGRARDKALDVLMESLDLMDSGKLEKEDAKSLSTIAANVSRVVEKTLPKEREGNTRAQLIVYAPTQINETRYERVEI